MTKRRRYPPKVESVAGTELEGTDQDPEFELYKEQSLKTNALMLQVETTAVTLGMLSILNALREIYPPMKKLKEDAFIELSARATKRAVELVGKMITEAEEEMAAEAAIEATADKIANG